MSDAFDKSGSTGNSSASSDMSNSTPPIAPQSRRTGGFFSRFFAALLVIIITAGITLLTIAIVFFSLGFALDTPQQIALGRATLATAQAQNNTLQLQHNLIQTQVADLDRRTSQERESLDEVRKAVADLNGLRAQLADSDVRSATAVAEARASGEQVAALATAEASRVTVLNEIAQRSERVERFLQRLSDISGDAAQDLSGATTSALPASRPTAPATPTETGALLGGSPTTLATQAPTASTVPTSPATAIATVTLLPTTRTAATPTAAPSAISATPSATPTR